MRGGKTRTVSTFPDIEDEIGYNPARFLETESWEGRATGAGDTTELATAKALIRGIDDVATIRHWITVEVALGRGDNGGPRKSVIRWLNQRQAQIEGQSASTSTVSDEANHEPETTTATRTTSTTNSESSIVADGGRDEETTRTCSVCRSELEEEQIGERIGHWCPVCSEFREPRVEGSA